MGRFSQERSVPDLPAEGFGSMIKGFVSRLAGMDGRSRVVEDDPRTWSASAKCRELGVDEFPVPAAVSSLFADGAVDSIYFSSMGILRGETRETYKWLVRKGDTVATATNIDVGPRAFEMLGAVCQMQNIALVKKEDGVLVWLARDGRAYDEIKAADARVILAAQRDAGEASKRSAMLASVASALKDPHTEEGLAAVGEKLRSKVGNPVAKIKKEPWRDPSS
jgi:hypothetical protein